MDDKNMQIVAAAAEGAVGCSTRCIICKETATVSGDPASSCGELEKWFIQAFLQSMEITMEGMEQLNIIPFCRRCRDKVVNLPVELANFRFSYTLLEQTLRDLAFTATDSMIRNEIVVGGPNEADNQKDRIAIAQARIREKLIQCWKPQCDKKKESCDTV